MSNDPKIQYNMFLNNRDIWNYLKEQRDSAMSPYTTPDAYVTVHIMHTAMYKPHLLMGWIYDFNMYQIK